MTPNEREGFWTWVVSSGVLVGLTVHHPTFERLKVKEADERGVRFEGRALALSRSFVEDNLSIVLAPTDLERIERTWQESRVQRSRRDARRRAYRLAQRVQVKTCNPMASLAEELRDVVRQASDDGLQTNSLVRTPRPTLADRELCAAWMGVPWDLMPDRARRMMMSARLAELGVATFLAGKARQIRDVSIEQISSPSTKDWLTHDLVVGETAVDVKNARANPERPEAYVEHCVPRFKKDRDLKDVKIAGVLSPWCPLERMEAGAQLVRLLGFTEQRRVDSVVARYSQPPLVVSLRRGLGGARFLPPWLFDFERRFGAGRIRTLQAIAQRSSLDWSECGARTVNLPAVLLAAGYDLKHTRGLTLSYPQLEFAEGLRRLRREAWWSLAGIYLSVLDHFVRCVVEGRLARFQVDLLFPVVFPTDDETRPLFVYDPLSTVNTLLQTLGRLADAGPTGLARFTEFRLSELNILLGRRGEGPWQTLLAYCGGWRDDHPCGNPSLVYGQERTCPACGKLVCPGCRFCSRQCVDGQNK